MFALLMGLKTISPGDLQQLVQQKLVTVIDVNSRQSWVKAHVPGTVNLDPINYTASDLPPDNQSPLVFYCSNPMCRKAPNAAPKKWATEMYASCQPESPAGRPINCQRNRPSKPWGRYFPMLQIPCCSWTNASVSAADTFLQQIRAST